MTQPAPERWPTLAKHHRRATQRAGRVLRRLADHWDPTGSHRWLSMQEQIERNRARIQANQRALRDVGVRLEETLAVGGFVPHSDQPDYFKDRRR